MVPGREAHRAAAGASGDVPAVDAGQASAVVTLEGTSSGGSGFFDPGAICRAPRCRSHHLSVSILVSIRRP
jgi:hypothetical protein